MSFYFQPPIFAVRPRGVAVGGWVYAACVPQPTPMAVVYAPAPPVVHATSCVPVLQTVYLPAPAPARAAPPPTAEPPRLTIRVVFHGRAPPPARTPWCRIADGGYARAPSAARLRADAALFAEQHGVAAYRDDSAVHARAGAVVSRAVEHARAGAVVSRAVEHALDVTHATAAAVRDALEGVLRGDGARRSLFLVVDVDAGAGAQGDDDGPGVVEVDAAQDEAAPEEEPAPADAQVIGPDGALDPEPAVDGGQQVHIDPA